MIFANNLIDIKSIITARMNVITGLLIKLKNRSLTGILTKEACEGSLSRRLLFAILNPKKFVMPSDMIPIKL